MSLVNSYPVSDTQMCRKNFKTQRNFVGLFNAIVFSSFSEHTVRLDILVKCRLKFSTSEMGPETLISSRFPGHADAVGVQISGAKQQSTWSLCESNSHTNKQKHKPNVIKFKPHGLAVSLECISPLCVLIRLSKVTLIIHSFSQAHRNLEIYEIISAKCCGLLGEEVLRMY